MCWESRKVVTGSQATGSTWPPSSVSREGPPEPRAVAQEQSWQQQIEKRFSIKLESGSDMLHLGNQVAFETSSIHAR
jgi:hypothetical protein